MSFNRQHRGTALLRRSKVADNREVNTTAGFKCRLSPTYRIYEMHLFRYTERQRDPRDKFLSCEYLPPSG